MKKFFKWLGIVLLVLVLIALIVLGMMGYIPGLSGALGANKPRDLGIKYTDTDLSAAREKGGVTREALPVGTGDSASIQFSGSHSVNTTWNSAEMTALLNNRPWKYWPISNVQMRINDDGTAEMSGIINAKKLQGYAAGIGTDQAVIDRIPLLPASAAFYIKGTSSLSNNSVATFDITNAQLGKMTIPASILLSRADNGHAYAADTVVSELEKYSGKKAAIVDFINEKLAWVSGFFAKSASFSGGNLNFDGTLPDKELTAR